MQHVSQQSNSKLLEREAEASLAQNLHPSEFVTDVSVPISSKPTASVSAGDQKEQDSWSIKDSEALYRLNRWGASYFSINNSGNIAVSPKGDRGGALDLFRLAQALEDRDLCLPLLIHFPNIIEDRITRLNACFSRAIAQYGYEGSYQGVFPIKVNQQRHVIKSVVRCGNQYKYGLEAGSKPELLIALAQLKGSSNALLICNGYKDKAYVETALLARRLGYQSVLVIEQLSEVSLALEVAKQHDIQPVLGIRAKLNCSGNNRWGNSTGDRAKFGLTAVEIIQAVEQLKAADMLDSLQLLHFHIGSQISAIAKIKEALNEAGQIYINLCQIGANMRYMDVGGGLGVDYDGSQTDSPASKNYSMQNYANDVVAEIQAACNSQQLASPTIVSESGRAIASHQSVLLIKVLGVDEIKDCRNDLKTDGYHPIVQEISDIYHSLDSTNCQELYNDLLQAKENIEKLFSLSYLTLQERATAESLFWGCCKHIQRLIKDKGSSVSNELRKLDEILTSLYYCNFSIFQSMPDSWAIDQLFPIMPIHRLGEKPTELGVLADLTCDSDGTVDQFIDQQRAKPYLELHKWTEKQPYYLGMFLGGAYQEIMGNLHNLFGDTNAVHVRLEEDGYHIEHVVRGDSVSEALSYVQYDTQSMIESLRQETERALKEKRITLQESLRFLKHYKDSLLNYTYLTED